jgi:hypothetical protein
MNIFLNNRYRKIHITDEKLFYVIYKKNKINITKYFKKNGIIKKEYKHLIQQKLKKVGGIGDKLVLCSFNVYSWEGYKSYPITFDKEFKKLITEKNVMLLLTQEDTIKDNDTYESVKAYSNNIESSRYSFITCINTSLQFYKGVVPRNAIIIEDTVFHIRIANLHLEGGRFVDLELDDNTFQTYLEIKLALLKEVLKMSPDIILGDFNSVYCNDSILLEQMHTAQQTYYNKYRNDAQHKPCDMCGEHGHKIKKDEHKFKESFTSHIQTDYGFNLIKACTHRNRDKKILSLEHVISWNNAPFSLLKEHGYTYIEPVNIKVDDKINPTNSRGENVIDHVWVKESIHERFTFSTEIYNGFGEAVSDLYGLVSDHKPIILTIEKKELDGATKELDGATKELDGATKKPYSISRKPYSRTKKRRIN